MHEQIKYQAGYKYQLSETYVSKTAVCPVQAVIHDFIDLKLDGTLTIKQGYAWDGCSGPTWDDKTNMRGGLVHDALYQLMREKLIDEGWRPTADAELRRICLEDGMSRFRAWYYHLGVRIGGESSAEWQEDKILLAP